MSRVCPYCSKCFKALGNHLPHCSMREGRHYSEFLSYKTLKKQAGSRKQQCPCCGRLQKRLCCSAHCKHTLLLDMNCGETSGHLEGNSTPQVKSQRVSTINTPSPPLHSLPMLRPFKFPTTEEGWAEADQHMATVVVPEVLSASTIEEKNHALCKGIYSFFSSKYGCRKLARKRRVKVSRKKSGTSLEEVKKERNRLRNELRKAKKSSQDTDSIRSIATKFHQLLRQYTVIKRAQHHSTESKEAEKQRKECASNFSRVAKEVLDDEGGCRECDPQFDEEVAQKHFEEVYSSGGNTFTCPSWLPLPPPPAHPFDENLI